MIHYDTPNGVKPRYDNKGTEFGRMHRALGPGYLMIDLDRILADVFTLQPTADGLLTEANKSTASISSNRVFYEYRITEMNYVIPVALYEVKYVRGQQNGLDPNNHEIAVLRDMAAKLKCRLFVVIGHGESDHAGQPKQPYDFHEWVTGVGFVFKGRLEYMSNDQMDKAIKQFYAKNLGIHR